MNIELKQHLDNAEYERKDYNTPQVYSDKNLNYYAESQIDKLLKIVYILAKENEELTDKVNELSKRVNHVEIYK